MACLVGWLVGGLSAGFPGVARVFGGNAVKTKERGRGRFIVLGVTEA